MFIGVGATPYKAKTVGAAAPLTGIAKIVDDNGFLNAWSSENTTEFFNITTFHDYLNEYDLINPSAANQPTFNASSANFNSKPSYSFDGTDDYVLNAVANYRGSDSSGVIIKVARHTSGGFFVGFCTADNSDNTNYLYTNYTSGRIRLSLSYSGTINSVRGGTVINDGTAFAVGYASTGSSYRLNVNGSFESKTLVSGADDGVWLNQAPNRDSLTIGSLQNNSPLYAGSEWVFSGYMPYTNDAAITTAINELKTHYGI